MTQTAEASADSRQLVASLRAFAQAHALWIGVAAIAVAASGFLLHQLMAWPPHEDETLALFVGRDSIAGVVEHVTRDRGGAPLHFLFAYAVAHLGLGLGSMRLVSATFAVASLPLIALLGHRLAGRWAALIATALAAGSWVFAGAWADPVRTSRAASMEGASQREERVNDEFMLRRVSGREKGPYNSTLRPRSGLLQVASPQTLVIPCAHWSFSLES